MESFDCVGPLIRLRFWEPYETSSLLYRRRYLQMRTPIVGYPDLLRCALLRNPNYNLSGFLISAKAGEYQLLTVQIIYLGSHNAASVGIRRTFDATSCGPALFCPTCAACSAACSPWPSYQDPNGRLLSQVLAGLKECNQGWGAHLVTMLPQAVGGSLLLWLQELVSAEHNGQLFRKLLQSEPDDAFTPRCLRDHYLRYDALNCFSLLLSLLARHTKLGRMGLARLRQDASWTRRRTGHNRYSAMPGRTTCWRWRRCVNPLTPAGGVGFEEFARLLQHLPGYASAAGYGATDKWRASIRKIHSAGRPGHAGAAGRPDSGAADRELWRGHPGAGVAGAGRRRRLSASEQERRFAGTTPPSTGSLSSAYRLLASCLRLPASQQPLPLPLAVEFSEDSTFRQALPASRRQLRRLRRPRVVPTVDFVLLCISF
uniref:ELMO domain-containing protein n=1 Tax=Macrostomum lignano TaxID=282301 RepID=A0A1I8FLD9_9PLAT